MIPILSSMILLLGVALVCGIVLTVTSILFAVKEDERQQPSVNVFPAQTAALADIPVATDMQRLCPRAQPTLQTSAFPEEIGQHAILPLFSALKPQTWLKKLHSLPATVCAAR